MTVEPLVPILRSAALVAGHRRDGSRGPVQFVCAGNSRSRKRALFLRSQHRGAGRSDARHRAGNLGWLCGFVGSRCASRSRPGVAGFCRLGAHVPRAQQCLAGDPQSRKARWPAREFSKRSARPASLRRSIKSTRDCGRSAANTAASMCSITTRWSRSMAARAGTTKANGSWCACPSRPTACFPW